MVSVSPNEALRSRQRACYTPQGLSIVAHGQGVVATISHQQVRLLLALNDGSGTLARRVATRVMRPVSSGPLTAAVRASAARGITRLCTLGIVERRDGNVVLTERGRHLVATRHAMMTELLDPAQPWRRW